MHENDKTDTLTYNWKHTPLSGRQSSDRWYAFLNDHDIGETTDYGLSKEEFSFTTEIDPGEYHRLVVSILGYYPEKIIHNGPATIVFWPDKTKTVVKCSENDIYDSFNAFTAALAKKIYGTTSSVKTMLKKSQHNDLKTED